MQQASKPIITQPEHTPHNPEQPGQTSTLRDPLGTGPPTTTQGLGGKTPQLMGELMTDTGKADHTNTLGQEVHMTDTKGNHTDTPESDGYMTGTGMVNHTDIPDMEWWNTVQDDPKDMTEMSPIIQGTSWQIMQMQVQDEDLMRSHLVTTTCLEHKYQYPASGICRD